MVCKNSFPSVPLPTHSSYRVPSSEPWQPLLGSSPGLLIPPVRGSNLRTGRPLAAIFPSTQAGLRTGYFRRPPSAVQDLSGNPPEQFSEPLGALWSSFGHSLVPSEAFCVARSAENLRKPKTFKNLRDFDMFRYFGLLLAPLGALLQHLAPLLGPLRPRWNTYKASRAVLKVSRTHLLPSRRPFGAFLGRLRRARGAPGEPSEAPKTCGSAPFWPSVSIFGSIRRFRHLRVPFWAVFPACSGP